MKKPIRLFLMVPTVALLIVAVCYLSFKAIEQSIIEENEVLVHSTAQSLMPALLAGDTQQVDRLLKRLESYPGIQSAELVSGSGIPIASYVRNGDAMDSAQAQFALASADEGIDSNGLHVIAPLTFDTQILANLHIAVNLWPAYLRIIQWLGLLLMLPSILYVVVKQFRIKIRFEKFIDHSGPGSDGEFNLDNALQNALNDAEISVEYQPVKRISDKGIYGAEVVICWRHPSGQTLHVSPSDFIALAERSGLFLPFDHWVLETACKQFSAWQHQHGPLVLALNIAPSQLSDSGFYQKVRDVCVTTQFPHQMIEFEINEAALLRSPNALADVASFTQQGMSLTVDGFGLSTQSHELLQSNAIHKIKFAPQLIKNVAQDAEMCAHVRSFAHLAHAHDVQLMADGLHSDDQTEIMQKLGCVLGQGPHLSRALSSKQFEELLMNQIRQAMAKQKLAQSNVPGPVLSY
jgi:EAL domain-containing protein (putative c-di-GMP-specific phosphodiesterase class I)